MTKDGSSRGLVHRPAGMTGAPRACGDEEVAGGGSGKVCRQWNGKRCHGNELRLCLTGEVCMVVHPSELGSSVAKEGLWHIQTGLRFSRLTIGLACIVFCGKPSRTPASFSAIFRM